MLAYATLQAAHDVDNMRLADLDVSVAHTEYELDALMLTGSCVDVTQGATRMVSVLLEPLALSSCLASLIWGVLCVLG